MADDDQLRNIGTQMANVMFNLAQRPGEPITGDTVAIMDGLRKKWDAAVRAEQSPQAACGESIGDDTDFHALIVDIMVAAKKAIPILEQAGKLEALIAHIDAKLTEARRVTEGWIDLKDQKPKDWQRVLVALNTGTVCEGYRGSVGWNWAETDHPDDAEATATHWKPWPKHPGATPSPDKG